jgi:hypothetical protein
MSVPRPPFIFKAHNHLLYVVRIVFSTSYHLPLALNLSRSAMYLVRKVVAIDDAK